MVSKDGAQVPMFVVAPINTSLDGTYPTVLYGYGGAPPVTSQLYSTLSSLLAALSAPILALSMLTSIRNADRLIIGPYALVAWLRRKGATYVLHELADFGL